MNKKVFFKLLITIACSIILFSLILGKISGFEIYEKNNFDKNISIEIEHPDGKSEFFDSVDFPLVNKGDIVYATVNLPKDRYIKDSAICFYVYHSVISIYDNNNALVYEYGKNQAEEGKMIGGIFVSADIPEESWGNTLTLKLEVQEDAAYSKLHDFMVIKSVDSYRYLLINKEVEFMIFSSILVLSVLVMFVLIIGGQWNSIKKQGIYLAGFLILISLWYLEFNGMLSIFINNKEFIGNIEYISLFLAPTMLALFYSEHNNNKYIKRIQFNLGLIFGAFAFICVILNNYTVNYHFCSMLPYFHVLLLLAIGINLSIVLKYGLSSKPSNVVIKYGGIISLTIIFIELIRYNIYKILDHNVFILSKSIISVAIIVFIISIILSCGIEVADHYISKFEKKNLEKLAYCDILTGIPNRAGCYKHFDTLNRYEENAVIFCDVNNLKYANDVFGHEMGDKLIKFVAEALRIAFDEKGFYGRFGGDEFVAQTTCDEVDECMNKLNEILINKNKEKTFPFKVSVSYGISMSSVNNPKSIKELLREADKKMYKYKKENKMNRQ